MTSPSEAKKETPADFEIARTRLMDRNRDCIAGASEKRQTIVQLFTPNDVTNPDSMIMSAAFRLIERIVPNCEATRWGPFQGCAGILMKNSDLEKVRETLLQEKSQGRGGRE